MIVYKKCACRQASMSRGRNDVRGEKYEALEYASFSLYIK